MPELSEKDQAEISREAEERALLRLYVTELNEFVHEFGRTYDLPSDYRVLGLLECAALCAVSRECVEQIPTPQIGKTWIRFLEKYRRLATDAAAQMAMFKLPVQPQTQIGDGQ